MPTYVFKNVETTEEFSQLMTIAERDDFLLKNPNIKQCLATPGFADPARLGLRKVDRAFNDVLTKAKSAHKDSTIDTF